MGRFKYEYELSAYLFTLHNGQIPPGWERYNLQTPIQPMTAVIDRARRLATVKTKDREIVLRDVPVGESPYNPSGLCPQGEAWGCEQFPYRAEKAAIRSALNGVGRLILEDHIQGCMVKAAQDGDFEEAFRDLKKTLDQFIG